MTIKFKKWFDNGEYTRYKVVLPAENFTNCPTKEVRIDSSFQVISKGNEYRVTTFGETRNGWLERAGVAPTGLDWSDSEKGVGQWSSPWMKKKDLLVVLERLIPLEIATYRDNPFIKEQFRNIELV